MCPATSMNRLWEQLPIFKQQWCWYTILLGSHNQVEGCISLSQTVGGDRYYWGDTNRMSGLGLGQEGEGFIWDMKTGLQVWGSQRSPLTLSMSPQHLCSQIHPIPLSLIPVLPICGHSLFPVCPPFSSDPQQLPHRCLSLILPSSHPMPKGPDIHMGYRWSKQLGASCYRCLWA